MLAILAKRSLPLRYSPLIRNFSHSHTLLAEDARLTEPRHVEEADVCIVGGTTCFSNYSAGPSGLSAAIKILQLAAEKGKELRVILLEKGGEVGAHILSGAVLEPRALNELIPNWRDKNAPLNQPALKDRMYFFTKKYAIPLPHPPQMSNKGNYIVSLNNFTRWLGEQAEEVGAGTLISNP